MTPTATYIAEENCLQELPTMEKPEPPLKPIYRRQFEPYYEELKEYERKRDQYNAHLATLRRIPCHDSCRGLWVEGQMLEEGVDYKIENRSVNIYDPPGTKVMGEFNEAGIITGGYGHHKLHAQKYIKPGIVYELERADIGGWHTDFYLKEFPGIGFNPVHFVYPEPTAFPLVPVKSEDELWYELMMDISGKFLIIQGDESHLKDIGAIDYLKEKFTLTKKQ